MESLLLPEDQSLHEIGNSEITFLGEEAMMRSLEKMTSIPSVRKYLFPLLVKEFAGNTVSVSITLFSIIVSIDKACNAENQIDLWPEVRKKALQGQVVNLVRAMTPNKSQADKTVRSNFFQFHKAYSSAFKIIAESSPDFQKKEHKKRKKRTSDVGGQVKMTLESTEKPSGS